jgi:hypothetical protein
MQQENKRRKKTKKNSEDGKARRMAEGEFG